MRAPVWLVLAGDPWCEEWRQMLAVCWNSEGSLGGGAIRQPASVCFLLRSLMISPLNPKECFPCCHGCTRKCEQVSRAPFWSIVLTIFTSLGSSEVLVLSRIAKPAVCRGNGGTQALQRRPCSPDPSTGLSWRQVAPGGSLTWARPRGLPLLSPSCASRISFFVRVTLLLWFSWFLSLHQCSFLLL